MVEVVVALLVFSIFIAGMTGLVLSARQAQDMARSHYIATNMAKNRLELARAIEYANIGIFSEQDVIVDANGNPDPDGGYRRTTVLGTVTPNLVRVRVSVEVRNRISLEFETDAIVVDSYIAEYVGGASE